MARKGRLIILNGVGSAGKSSIAKALQQIMPTPWLHIEMDKFCEMLPERYQDHPEGFAYETKEEDGKPIVIISEGPYGAKLIRGMRRAIAVMAAEGNDLIVDDVMWGEAPRRLRCAARWIRSLLDHVLIRRRPSCPTNHSKNYIFINSLKTEDSGVTLNGSDLPCNRYVYCVLGVKQAFGNLNVWLSRISSPRNRS